MSVSGLSEAGLRRMHDVLNGHVERGEVPGLVALIGRGGEPHVETIGAASIGGAAIQRDAIFRMASMTKPLLAAATMLLVEECVLRLDDPVLPWLPELADRRVLKRIDGPLDDTEPANRPITVRDLLTLRLGIGAVLAPPGSYPIQTAIAEAGLDPGPDAPTLTHDEWIERLGGLPLVHQPGEGWMYHTGFDVLCVLLPRVTGQPLAEFLRERLFEPLGMVDTGFHVPAEKLHRLTTSYRTDPETGALAVHDDPADSVWAAPPPFASEVVSTVDDYWAFSQLLNNGRYGERRLLSRPSVELMRTDQLTAEQKASGGFLLNGGGWGFGMGVAIGRDNLWSPGRFGWMGGLGTSGYTDPAEGLVTILLTQLMLDSPQAFPLHADFWTTAYATIDD